jgi:hypoxanthine phosphoribosyltransferase
MATPRRWQLSEADVVRYSRRLAEKLVPFGPEVVVYLGEGGVLPGKTVALALGIQAQRLAIFYPYSQHWNPAGTIAKVLSWPIKEALYHLTSPVINQPMADFTSKRVAVVDDSASSGRTLVTVLDALDVSGVPRSQIRTAVLRCGRRARKWVDHFEIG